MGCSCKYIHALIPYCWLYKEFDIFGATIKLSKVPIFIFLSKYCGWPNKILESSIVYTSSLSITLFAEGSLNVPPLPGLSLLFVILNINPSKFAISSIRFAIIGPFVCI